MKTDNPRYKHSQVWQLRSLLPVLSAALTVFVSLFFLTPITGFSQQLSALEIMRQAYSRERGISMESTVEMILTGDDGQQRKRKIKTFSNNYKTLTKKAVFFLAPADVKGTALLTYDYQSNDQEDEQWIYLPFLHKTKRISAGNRSGSFMGSDFSYGDLTRKSLESYSYKLIKEQQVDKHPVWIIESIPKNKETINQYGYSKSLFIIRQDNFVIIRAVHWLQDKGTLKYNEIIKLDKIDDIWIPLEVHAKTVRNGKTIHQTLLINKDVRLNQPIDDKIFTKRQLEHGF